MDAGTAHRANAILEQLLAQPASRRAALVETLCAGDAPLRALVQRLLAHADGEREEPTWDASGALHAALDALFQRAPEDAGVSRAGPFRLLQRLGSGGSAEVFLGERDVDGVVQRVAVKFLRSDAASPAMQARFRQEQRILASLSHPGIASILDLGVSEDGRAYFVMEYVDGEPIDAWCDRRALDLRERLDLFVQVADAVAHAHRALVVHRDIKPGNVLVDADGRPRLLDFGIAKVLDAGSDLALTEPGGAPATLGYASPEQLRGDPVGITSDVYQLGMLLYVLLAGVRPSAPRGLGRADALALASAPALAPSQRLRRLRADADAAVADIARHRRSSVRSLLRTLSGDLDRVVARALAPDPEQRYPSAVHLADDVRNVLAGRPVQARPGSAAYRFGKLLRRHRLASALVFALSAGVLAFAVVVAMVALDLEQARRSAVLQGQLSERVLDLVVAELRSLEPQLSGFDGSIVRQALDRVATAPAAQFGEDPQAEVHLRLTLGKGYENLWAVDDAATQYAAAADALSRLPAADRARLEPRVLLAQGRIARIEGRGNDAVAAFRRAIALAADDRGALATVAAARANLGAVLDGRGQRAEAQALYRGAAVDFTRLYGPRHPSTLALGMNVAISLLQDGAQARPADRREARLLLAQLVASASEALGPAATLTLTLQLLHGRALCLDGDTAECERTLATHLPEATRALGAESLQVLRAVSEHGLALVRLGRPEQGLATLQRASQDFVRRWDSQRNHGSRHDFGLNLALGRMLAGRPDAAVEGLLRHGVDPALVRRVPELAPLAGDARLAQFAAPAGD
jgi:serine/threonine-protein kinase